MARGGNLPPVSAPWISAVIPAYNEEKGIVAAVSALAAWLDAQGRSYELLVVDNASDDRTAELLSPLADGARVQLLRNEENRGKGYSVRRGMLAATGELRLHCDADCVPCLPSLPGSFKLWRAEAAEAVYSRTRLDGWTFDAEALAMAHALGYQVVETGIVWNERQGSRLSMARVLVPVVRELVEARRHVRAEAAERRRARLVPEPVDPRP